MRPFTLYLFLLLLATASALCSLGTGSITSSWQDLLAALQGHSDKLGSQVILELRWPRTAAAFVTGALLSLAGGLMQVLLRNPLADPYVLGISGGAATDLDAGGFRPGARTR
jgi:iron complex transport system permease protein